MLDALFIASGLEGPNKGGIQYSAQLAWEAVRTRKCLGGEPSALLSFGDVAAPDMESANGQVWHSRSRPGLIGKIVTRRWHAREALFWHLGLTKVLPLLALGPARVQVFLHGIEAWRPLSRFTSWCLRRVDRFLTNSEFTWQRFVQHNPRFASWPHRVVHLGIGGKMPGEAGPPAVPPAALIIGRLLRAEAYKGHHEIISVWPQVHARVPGSRLWIVGDGDLRPELERLAAERGCGESVVFWGRVSESKKEELLQQSRCLAMPSRGEGFGLVYLEAMRLGRPCLVSQHDAGREVVNPPEAGLEVDPNDPAALTTALVRLLQAGSEWEKWSAAGRRRYETSFTAADFQARLLDAMSQR